jgi:nucleotide-binding universal stress UspA family protein
MSRILVYAPPNDGARIALGEAARVARRDGSCLHVLRVLDAERWLARGRDTARAERLRCIVADGQREALEASVEPLRASGTKVDVEVRWGTPWLELVRAVLRGHHTLVVKAAEGAASSRRLFLGSTALHLIRKCPSPVWIVGAASRRRGSRVLAAVDPQATDRTRLGLARRVLALAQDCAGVLEGELHAVGLWQAPAARLLEPRLDQAEFDAWLAEAEADARTGLAHIARGLLAPARVRLERGDPRERLPALVESEGFDVLVLGSLGEVGAAGLLIGETAETVIRSVRCSILAVKPDGFVCPVRVEDAAGGSTRTARGAPRP